MPEVSVIMTNYNYGNFITKSIESVLSQTFKSFELIIIDDGSNDNSRNIINRYCSMYPNLIKCIFKNNGGQNSAFNDGFSVSVGDIICTLDSDDYYYPNMLENKVDMHNRYPDCGMCDTMLTTDGKSAMTLCRDDINYHEYLIQYGYIYSHNCTSGLSFRRDVLKDFIPLKSTELMMGGLDCVLTHIALATSNTIIDSRIGGFYRQHNQDSSEQRKNWNSNSEYYKIYIEKLKAYARMQLYDHGYYIPENDSILYDKLINDNIDTLSGKRIVVFGTASIARKVILALEKKKLNIVFCTDNAEHRRSYENEVNLPYEIVPSKFLCNRRKEFDKIVIGSRQSKAISTFLNNIGFNETEYIILAI